LKQNRWFFSGFFQFMLFGGVLLLLMDTGDFVWFFNGQRSAWADVLFVYGTKLGEPIGFLLGALGLLFVKLRHTLALPLLGLSVSIVSYPLKQFFAHDRPLPYFRELDLDQLLLFVEGVKVHTGASSFPSGHTMAGFALFAFLAFCIPNKKWGGILFFLLALIVGLSRIYLTQHFFKDVYFGGFLGVVLAVLWYYLQQLPKAKWLDWKWEVGRRKAEVGSKKQL
jgi:membrane-associated phospholipid phosphatase